jgi:hypothetical protein
LGIWIAYTGGTTYQPIACYEKGDVEMTPMKKSIWALVALLLLLMPLMIPAWAAEVTITGEVNDSYQIVADGQIYEIADTVKGNELAENHVNTRVKVTGTVEEQDDMKVITVKNYQILAE